MMKKIPCLLAVLIMLIGFGMNGVTAQQELENKVKKGICKACVVKISAALLEYERWHKMNFKDGPHAPKSLHDPVFINRFLNGELPKHPLGWDWDNYYDSQKSMVSKEGEWQGKIDKNKACDLLTSEEKQQLREGESDVFTLGDFRNRRLQDSTNRSYGSVISVSSEQIVIEEQNRDTGEKGKTAYAINPENTRYHNAHSSNDIKVGDKVNIIYTTKDSKKIAALIRLELSTFVPK